MMKENIPVYQEREVPKVKARYKRQLTFQRIRKKCHDMIMVFIL